MAKEQMPTPVYMVTEDQLKDLFGDFAKQIIVRIDELASTGRKSESDEDPLIGYDEVGRLLGVSKSTLWRYVKDGSISPIRLSKQAVKFRKSEILKLREA